MFYILVGSSGFYFINLLLFFFGENFAKIVGVLTLKNHVLLGKILINFQENRVLDWVCQTTTRSTKTKYHPTCPIAKSS